MFCDRAKAVFDRRNELVHSSFPAQPDGRLWGHRPMRDKAITDGSSATVETTMDELRAFVSEAARLVLEFNDVHAFAGLRSAVES